MQFFKIALAATVAGVATASYDYGKTNTTVTGSITYTTEIVTEYTTLCPEATTFPYNGVTITATKNEIITLPCPCTVVKPITVSTVTSCSTCGPTTTSAPASAYTYVNATGPVDVKTSTTVGTASGAITSPSSPTFTGGANKVVGGAAAGLVGLAAFLL